MTLLATTSPDINWKMLEEYAATLEDTGEYRVLRRINPEFLDLPAVPSDCQNEQQINCLMLDFETTGTDQANDEIIEMAAIPFRATVTGQILHVGQNISWLNEPSRPIPEPVTRLTGISDEMVKGHTIDLASVEYLLEPVDLVIAHVAKFDRPFAERLHPAFAAKDWACSESQVPWRENGLDSTKLTHIATQAGLFYGAHRALDDCAAAITLLANPLPGRENTALSYLLTNSKKGTIRIWAVGAPYEKKDLLRDRKYRWSDGANAQPKAWWTDVPQERYDDEVQFLHSEIFGRILPWPTKIISARDRFSSRA